MNAIWYQWKLFLQIIIMPIVLILKIRETIKKNYKIIWKTKTLNYYFKYNWVLASDA